jgi:hypothetical protein
MLAWMRGLRTGNPLELLCPMIGYADTPLVAKPATPVAHSASSIVEHSLTAAG